MSARLLQSMQHCVRLLQRYHVPRLPYYTQSYATVATLSKSFTANSRNAIDHIHLPYSTKAASAAAAAYNKPLIVTLSEQFNRLESQYQQKAQISAEQYERLLALLENPQQQQTVKFTVDQCNFLLSVCAAHMPRQTSADRLALFSRMWQQLQQRGLLAKQHYFTRLLVLQYNRQTLTDFREFLNELAALDGEALRDGELYAELLATACAAGNMHQATEVLAEMRNQQLPLTERNFNALLLGHGREQNLRGCQTVLDSMQATGVPLSTETQTALMQAYLENGEIAKASDILHRYHRQFDAVQVLRMLRSVLFVDLDASFVAQLVRELPAEYTNVPEVAPGLRNLCVELLHNGKLEIVLTIISTLPPPTFNDNQDIDTYGVFLILELFRVHVDVERVLDVAQSLRTSGKNTRALHLAIEIALRRNPALAPPLLEALQQEEPLRTHYFWPLLLHNATQRGEQGLFETLQLMTQLGVACDEQTLQQYVLPRLLLTLEVPEETIKKLDAVGLKPSLTLNPVLTHLLLQQQQIKEAINLLQLYPTHLDVRRLLPALSNLAVNVRATRRYAPYAKLLAALRQKSQAPKLDLLGQLLIDVLAAPQSRFRSDRDAVRRLLNECQKCGLQIGNAACDTVKSLLPPATKASLTATTTTSASQSQSSTEDELWRILNKMRDRSLILPNQSSDQQSGNSNSISSSTATSSSSFIKHPRDMTIDELEFHLIELEAKRMNTRGVLRRLLQLCVRDGRLKRALEVKTKCDELKVQVSPGMLASVFDLYIKLKDLPKAERTLRQLQKDFPAFPVDEHKFIDYAALLVHCGQLEKGKQLLQQRATTQKITGGDYVLKNIWNFLTAVAQQAATQHPPLPNNENWTRETFVYLQKLGYCRSHNTVLGPIVREFLLRGDIHSAVAEFQRLAEQYKHTPLQYELLSLLVRLSNTQNQQQQQQQEQREQKQEQRVEEQEYAIEAEEAQRLLSTLTTTIASIHGMLNMNSALLLAFAESGTDAQLRRLLIDPEFRINHEMLIKNCEHLSQSGAVRTLLRLGRGARGLSRVVDEQQIYNMLLQNFAQANNYQAALDLYDRLEADDELKISQEFLRQLVKLLKLNNLEIPSGVALRAQIL